MKQYDKGVDYKLLEGMGISVVRHQPWQLGLFHEELVGKFVWYPGAGTLMYQNDDRSEVYVVGYKGQFCAEGKPNVTEDVYIEISKKVDEQLGPC